MNFGIVYHPFGSLEQRIEWFVEEEKAKARAEKVMSDGVRVVHLVKRVAALHAEPSWSKL